jgi:hypothetical protein
MKEEQATVLSPPDLLDGGVGWGGVVGESPGMYLCVSLDKIRTRSKSGQFFLSLKCDEYINKTAMGVV